MRYHSPFMMKSDKSPPSSELSTRSSYQGQSLIKTGTYLHDGDIPLGNSKQNVRMQLQYFARVYQLLYASVYETVASATLTLRDKTCKTGKEREKEREGEREFVRPRDGARWFLPRGMACRANSSTAWKNAFVRSTGGKLALYRC